MLNPFLIYLNFHSPLIHQTHKNYKCHPNEEPRNARLDNHDYRVYRK